MLLLEVVIVITLCVGCVLVRFVILAVRDARRNRILREQIPLEDRIDEIRLRAAQWIRAMEKTVSRVSVERPAEAVDWIPPVVGYYRRLESLAADPAASVVEIEQLAQEAESFVTERQLKGVFISVEAKELAVLVRRRDTK